LRQKIIRGETKKKGEPSPKAPSKKEKKKRKKNEIKRSESRKKQPSLF
jgi:hypothetical protein